jgi:hypothetical protein
VAEASCCLGRSQAATGGTTGKLPIGAPPSLEESVAGRGVPGEGILVRNISALVEEQCSPLRVNVSRIDGNSVMIGSNRHSGDGGMSRRLEGRIRRSGSERRREQTETGGGAAVGPYQMMKRTTTTTMTTTTIFDGR